MISPDDLNRPYTTGNATVVTPIDVNKDVIPIYSNKKDNTPPSKFKLGYDILMLVAIVVDLAMIFFDQIVMSVFFTRLASWVGLAHWQLVYQEQVHHVIATIGGFFTLFLIAELSVRWLIAIKKQTYYRWFFFPFVHWYEVLGCFPLLRPLRLLRAFVIIKRLHAVGKNIIPVRWIKTAKFYGHILLEELSDRVILTAIDNLRNQIKASKAHQALIENTLDKNRAYIEQAVLELLRYELSPRLQQITKTQTADVLAEQIGQAVERALGDTPELRRYLRLIPIAGSMIEAQMMDIGKSIGEEVTQAVNKTLLEPQMLDKLMIEIATGVAHIDINHPALKQLIANIIDDSLNAFEAQVKIQQWKHTEHLQL